MVPGRWSEVRLPSKQELTGTLVLSLSLNEASAKVRTGPPKDDDADYALPVWAGELPLRLAPLAPIPDPQLISEIALPTYVQDYGRHFTGAIE